MTPLQNSIQRSIDSRNEGMAIGVIHAVKRIDFIPDTIYNEQLALMLLIELGMSQEEASVLVSDLWYKGHPK